MILGIVLLMGLCTFVGIKYFPWEPKMNLSGLKKMWYSEGDGGWSYWYHYDLKEKEGTYLLTFEQSFPDPYKKEKNLTADEVKKLEEVISELSDEDYSIIKNNVKNIGDNVINGKYLHSLIRNL